MMPDKIYVNSCGSFESAFTTGRLTQLRMDDIEYIRKDYLLEWATNQSKYSSDGYVRAMRDLIDKINEL